MSKNDHEILPVDRQPQDNMRPPAAARYLGVSESHLAKLRMLAGRKNGPAYAKVAGCIIYRRADLDAWIAAHVVEFSAP